MMLSNIFYYLFIVQYLFIIYCLQRQHAGSVLRQHAACHSYLWFIICVVLFIYNFISFIYYVVPAAAACRRHSLAAWCRPLLFTNLLFNLLLVFIYHLFTTC
jgi:hypothetical protein